MRRLENGTLENHHATALDCCCRGGFLDLDPDRFVRIENTYRTIANETQVLCASTQAERELLGAGSAGLDERQRSILWLRYVYE